MNNDKPKRKEDLYVPTPKEVEMHRGKRRRRRVASESSETSKPERQHRRRKGFRISKHTATRRTETSAPRRPSVKRGPDSPKEPDPTTPHPTDSSTQQSEESKPDVAPKTTDIKIPNTRAQTGSRIRTIRPKHKRPIAPPVSKPEEDEPQDGIPLATYKAEKRGHQLNPWENQSRDQKGRDENHYAECRVCGRRARATLESDDNYPDSFSTWRHHGDAIESDCPRS